MRKIFLVGMLILWLLTACATEQQVSSDSVAIYKTPN